MLDIFISNRSGLLANWAGISSDPVYRSIAEVKAAKNEACLFWLHADANSHGWISSCIKTIFDEYAGAKVIVLANVPQQDDAVSVLQLGAQGYCHAYSETSVLTEVRAVVSHGGIWLGQALLQHLIGISRQVVPSRPQAVSAVLGLLSAREREVAQQAALGFSNKQIARTLNITERTVKAHLSATFEKLGIKDRLQLALVLNDGARAKVSA